MTKPSIRDIYLALSQAHFDSTYADKAPAGAMVVAKELQTVRALLKGIDGGSEDSTRGLAVGLVACLDSFSLLEQMPDNLDEEHLGNILIVKCDEEFLTNPKEVIEELLLWHPTHSAQLTAAEEDEYSGGIALALYIIHCWLQKTYKKEYDITNLHGDLANHNELEPLGEDEAVEDTRELTQEDPVVALFSKISTLCENDSVSFRFDYVDNELLLSILFAGSVDIADIQLCVTAFGESNTRLISKNDVISIMVKPF